MADLMTVESPDATLEDEYRLVRGLTEELAAPLSPEDQTVQSMPDTSPTKWHRAHTTWFFETFLLQVQVPSYRVFNPAFAYLFNSYYESIGDRFPRPHRGVVSRPGAAEIAAYRAYVDDAMTSLVSGRLDHDVAALVALGLHHEQQHQELLLMDIKHVLGSNPMRPAYLALDEQAPGPAPAARAIAHPGGIVQFGYEGSGFSFDNECPRHEVLLQPFSLDARPVTCGDWIAFIQDGGYSVADHWLSDGWAAVKAGGWSAPMYWSERDDGWSVFTLGGERLVRPAEPVCHVSYYEADAFARWAGARLPTEAEWEAVAGDRPVEGNFLDRAVLHPRPVGAESSLFGDVWQWTSSDYCPYPGFRPAAGAVGEYNGKFMVSQHVLRGGSCVTPVGHTRASYRNFFPPSARWPFTGLRLAHDR